jgi:hypothetical protein
MSLPWRSQKTDRPGGRPRATSRSECGSLQIALFGGRQSSGVQIRQRLSGAGGGQCYFKRPTPPSVADQSCVSAKRTSAQEEMHGNIGGRCERV